MMFEKHGEFRGRLVTIKDSGTPKQFRCEGMSDLNEDHALLTFDGRFHSKTVRFDQLELVPMAEERTPQHKAGYLRSGDFGIHSDEATEWFAFVMLQAGMLFQSIPSFDPTVSTGEDPARAELLRLLTVRGENPTGPVVLAAMAYYDAAFAWYQTDDEA